MTGINILSVEQLNFYIKSIIDQDPVTFNLFVEGQVSNLKSHFSSGHIYFSLKDEKAVVRCVMFARDAQHINFSLEDGMKIIVRGRASLYEATGQYQIYVQDIVPAGIGKMQIEFEALKKKLFDEGLFDESHKRALPRFPKKIGIITSKSGAVIEDIKNVIFRRYPVCALFLKAVSVQGENASHEIEEAIKFFNEKESFDVLIIARGGGSIEDLAPFNKESLARAIFNSKIPIVSAVGHETDFTICDFVADLRAPTPSAAAELVVPESSEILNLIQSLRKNMKKSIDFKIYSAKEFLKGINLELKTNSPRYMIDNGRATVEELKAKFKILISENFHVKYNEYAALISKLEVLNPLSIINRGYSLAYKEEKIVKKVTDVDINDIIEIRVSDGTIMCRIEDLKVGVKK